MSEDRPVTFKPLKGGRYKCNRDGAKVKKGRTHAHRVLHTQDPKAMARLAAARRLKKQAEAAEEERRRNKESYTQLAVEEERRERSREEAWLRFNQVNRTLWGRF